MLLVYRINIRCRIRLADTVTVDGRTVAVVFILSMSQIDAHVVTLAV